MPPNCKYPIATIEVGETVFINAEVRVNPDYGTSYWYKRTIENAICAHQRRHGKRFKYYVCDTGVKVTRLA